MTTEEIIVSTLTEVLARLTEVLALIDAQLKAIKDKCLNCCESPNCCKVPR